MKAKSKSSGSTHSARIVVKKTKASTSSSYIKTAYVGITKKVLVEDASVRYRVKHGRKFIASGEMTLAQAQGDLQKESGRKVAKKRRKPTRGCSPLGQKVQSHAQTVRES